MSTRPFIRWRKPSYIPTTSQPELTASMVTELMALLMPGAGPPAHQYTQATTVTAHESPLLGRSSTRGRLSCFQEAPRDPFRHIVEARRGLVSADSLRRLRGILVGRLDLNQRPPRPERGALPTALRPDLRNSAYILTIRPHIGQCLTHQSFRSRVRRFRPRHGPTAAMLSLSVTSRSDATRRMSSKDTALTLATTSSTPYMVDNSIS